MKETGCLKVTHIASGDLWAGAEVQLLTLAQALQSTSDVIVEVILLNHGRLEKELRANGINTTIIDETRLNSVTILLQMVKTLRKTTPDIIHTHRLKENSLGSIASKICGNIPSIRTSDGAPVHLPAFYNLPKRLILLMNKFCGRYLQQKIIAVSDDLAEILAQRYPAKKIYVIYNGIDVETLEHATKRLMRSPKTKDASFKIGIAGRIVPIKRIDLFIQTAHLLMSEHPNINLSFHIYGDGPLQKSLEALNQQSITNNRVIFEGHCESIHQQVQQLDLLLMTSDHEGLPMILLEAMALRTPIIAHAVGGIPELLDQGTCGLLVRQQKPEAYMQSILQIIENPAISTSITNNAYLRVNEHYSATTNALSYIKIYRQISH